MTKRSKNVGNKVKEFAEDLGRIFGEADMKAGKWMSERATILETLTSVRNQASRMIAKITEAPAQARSTQPARSNRRGGKRKRTVKLSAAGRAAISAAQKLRWAKYNAAKNAKKK